MAEIVLKIPKEFFPNSVQGKHDINDCFERVIAELKSSSERGDGIGDVVGRYELETLVMLQEAIRNATVIDDHGKLVDASNGKYMFDYNKENPTYTGKDVEGAFRSMTGIVPPTEDMQTIDKQTIEGRVNEITRPTPKADRF